MQDKIESIKKYVEKGALEPRTLWDQIVKWSDKYGDKTAVVDGNLEVSYRKLYDKALRTASGFNLMGIKKGDRVVVQLPNSISFVITLFALFRIGAVPILSLPAHREKELNGIMELAEPVAYIFTESILGFNYTSMAMEFAKNHNSLKFLISDKRGVGMFCLEDIETSPSDFPYPSFYDTAVLLLSGGTTGTPKLIPRTHADYAYVAEKSSERCMLTQDSVYLAVLPVAHNFPLCCPGILGIFSVGGKAVMSRTSSFDETFSLIEKEKVSITAVVPSIANMWIQALEWEDADLSSLKLIQIGGSPLDRNLAERIMPEMGCRLQQVFGMAEGLLCYTSPDDSDDIILDSQGKPLCEHDEIKVVDEDGNEVAPGEFGELCVKGIYTIKGYYRVPEINKESFTSDGYFKSGDKVRFTKDGNIQVRGRFKEQVNRAGEKITASEIEFYLNSHEAISDSAVVPVVDEVLGERSCAFVMGNESELSLGTIREFFMDKKIASFKVPDQLEFIKSWPLTSVGKIDKKKLSKIAGEKDKSSKRMEYIEKTYDFEDDPLSCAVRISESAVYDDFLIYESRDEISLGMGVFAFLTVNGEKTELKFENESYQLKNGILPETIEKVLSFLPVENYRLYGITNFEFSRYIYGLDSLNESKNLLEMFIPEAELRFKDNKITIRALKEEVFDKLKVHLDSIINKDQEESFKTDIFQRIAEHRTNIPVELVDADYYKEIVAEAVGEINQPRYQKVILSRKVPVSRKIDMAASYLAGREVNTPARSFLLNIKGLRAAGFSPETVVEVDNKRNVSTQPLAGTRATGESSEEEIKLREELLNDSKEIAEHAISIKLAFEEMLQVCDQNTISVCDFMSIARRGTVQHIASRLRGILKEGKNSWDAFSALFPAVTASGIPKKQAIEAIGRFEKEARNLYSGCVLTYDSDGTMDAALVLRTIFQNKNESYLQAGAGIVDMSVPVRELEETCEKLRSVSKQLVYI